MKSNVPFIHYLQDQPGSNHSTTRMLYPCLKCGKEFGAVGDLKEHYSSAHIRSSGGATIGGSDSKSIVVEPKNPNSPKSSAVTCSKCGKMYSRMRDLKNHIWEAHNGYKQFPSDEASTSNKCLSNRVHRVRWVRNKKPLPCVFCDEEFATRTSFMEHIDKTPKHFLSTIYNTTCFLCDKKCYNFRDHLVTEHKVAGEVNFLQCSKCPKTCWSFSALAVHFVEMHRGRKVHDDIKFSCPVCGKVFGTESNLKRHILIHYSAHQTENAEFVTKANDEATANPEKDQDLYNNIVLPDVPNIVSSIEVKEEEITDMVTSEDKLHSPGAPSQILCGSQDGGQEPILTPDISTAPVKVEQVAVGDNVMLLPKVEQVQFDPMPSTDSEIDPLAVKTEPVADAAHNEDPRNTVVSRNKPI